MNPSHARLYVLNGEPAESDSAGFADSGVHSLVATIIAAEPIAIFPASLRPGTASSSSSGEVAPKARVRWAPGHGWTANLALGWVTRVALALNVVALVAALALAIAPMVLQIQVYSVLSGSMTPNIPIGSVVFDRPVPVQQLKAGDVITFEPPGHRGTLVTHRIISTKPDGTNVDIRTKGDANPVPDAWELNAHGIGYRYMFSVPYLGYFVIWAQSMFGRIVLIAVPALLLVGLYLLESWSDRRAPQGR